MDLSTLLLLASLGLMCPGAPTPVSPEPSAPPLLQAAVTGAYASMSAEAPGAPPPFSASSPSPQPPSEPWSLGQPPRFKWIGAGLASGSRGIGVIGVGRDLANPLAGILGWRLEGFAGASQKGAEGGGRLLLTVPIAKLHIGIDYDARTDTFERMMGFNLAIRRGGVLGGGSTLRVEWWSKHGQALHVGVQVPIGQRAGATRPRTEYVRVPPKAPKAAPPDRMAAALARFRRAASDVNAMVAPLHDRWSGDAVKAVAPDVAVVRRLATPDEVAAGMSRAWIEVFSAALEGHLGRAAPDAVAAVANLARHAVLDEVLIPYDALMGRQRRPDSLRGFTQQASRVFGEGLSTHGALDASSRADAMTALAAVIEQLDELRDDVRDEWGEARKVFLPLQLALQPEEHDTQAEIDALLERVTGSRFSNGNRIWYVINERFQFEFERTVRRAKRFHVLWIHDYRGKADRGAVDLVGLAQTLTYLEALTEHARAYDAVRAIPEYYVLLDEFFYESNAGRRWMTLLENPLATEVSLPAQYAEQERELRRVQQELRAAVAASRALQESRAKFGQRWLERLVRVRVNITNPADWSFWNSESVPIWGLPDNLFRDHRKIVFYDLSEDDPYAGEAMFTGMGIGEKYASAEWEDRALIVQGPAALRAKLALRDMLRQQGARADQIPAVFQERPLAADYAARVDAEIRRAEAAGRIPPARAMQTHNEVGFGYKRVSVTKLLLFSLLPPGGVIIAPDSMWQSHLYGSLLAGSALRGCRVLVITPATANSPVSSRMVQARTHMMTSRLIAFSRAVGDRIAAQGGLLKVGLFREQAAVNDISGRVRALRSTLGTAGPWLHTLVPVSADALEAVEASAADLARVLPPSSMVEPSKSGRPMLHMKGLFIASAESWNGWTSHPQFGKVFEEYVHQRFRQVSGDRRVEVDVRELPNAVWPLRRQLLDAHEAGQTPEVRARRLYYLQIGSFNMNNRSMLTDGEAALTVSGPAALSGLIDFLMVTGLSVWVENQQQIDELIPPPSASQRLRARWLRNIL